MLYTSISNIFFCTTETLGNRVYLVYNKLVAHLFWRGGRVVEGSGLENRHSEQLSRVRIPLSPS
jgi:hypothetical protein